MDSGGFWWILVDSDGLWWIVMDPAGKNVGRALAERPLSVGRVWVKRRQSVGGAKAER